MRRQITSIIPANVPMSAIDDLTSAIVPVDTRTGSVVRLIITIEDNHINVRDFGAYLTLIDRLYGRLTESGLRSYAHSIDDQIEIAEIKFGSIEINITEILTQYKDATPIVILWLFLKYLPDAIKTLSEASKNRAEFYKTMEDVKLARINRQRIKNQIVQEEALQKLTPNRLNQIVALLEALEARESRYLPPVIRFARGKVKKIDIEVKEIKEKSEDTPELRQPRRKIDLGEEE